jgi:hypothetical protein
MLDLFGLTLPTTTTPLDRELATVLAGRMAAAAAQLKGGAPGAVASAVRADAQRYLSARRRGELHFAGAGGRACDDGALALMRLTVDAPALAPRPLPLVA